MPGYLHSVPSSFVVPNYGGQAGTKAIPIPVHEIDVRSHKLYEDDDEYEDDCRGLRGGAWIQRNLRITGRFRDHDIDFESEH